MGHFSIRRCESGWFTALGIRHVRHPVCGIPKEAAMSKRARKRRSRKKNGANHGKKPNA